MVGEKKVRLDYFVVIVTAYVEAYLANQYIIIQSGGSYIVYD